MKTTTKKWAYYNEFDPGAAAWLRELMKRGLIMEGEIDERSITEVRPEDVRGFVRAHWFAGIGGRDFALKLAGWPDDEPVWTGSCPCQPFSGTGKQLGSRDPRHLFPPFRKLIARLHPARVYGEQVASGLGREWLARVRLEMATLGYATRAADLCSAGLGSPNIRQRLFWVADADGREPWHGGIQSGWEHGQLEKDGAAGGVGNAMCERRNEGPRLDGEIDGARSGKSESSEPSIIGRLAYSNSGQRDGLSDGEGRECDGTQAGRIEGDSQPECGGATLRMGDPHRPGPQGRDERGHGGDERAIGAAGVAGGMEHAQSNGREQWGAESSRRSAAERCGDGTAHLATAGNYLPTAGGFWDRFDMLQCTDGKTRRIEPGSFPLAHGISGRVGLLRGYGNAINPYVAAAFIRATQKETGGRGLVTEDWS